MRVVKTWPDIKRGWESFIRTYMYVGITYNCRLQFIYVLSRTSLLLYRYFDTKTLNENIYEQFKFKTLLKIIFILNMQ